MKLSALALALLASACSGEKPAPGPAPSPPPARPVVIVSAGDPPPETVIIEGAVTRTWIFTCEDCASVMRCGEENPGPDAELEMVYESPAFSDCLHDWRPGTYRAHQDPVPDGTVVLVKRGLAYGGFILSGQESMPERAEYRWWFRSDGGGRLDAGPPEVTSGEGVCDVENDPGAKVEFGPFRVDWSGNTEGRGFLYYARPPGELVSYGATRLCVTDLTEIDGVDAADPKWRFKGTPVD